MVVTVHHGNVTGLQVGLALEQLLHVLVKGWPLALKIGYLRSQTLRGFQAHIAAGHHPKLSQSMLPKLSVAMHVTLHHPSTANQGNRKGLTHGGHSSQKH
jgi:hypothetical protein